jgi:hypothetical protein
MADHSKTGQKSLVFEWFLTKWPPNLAAILFLPFETQTQKVSERWPLESRTIPLSDVYCI